MGRRAHGDRHTQGAGTRQALPRRICCRRRLVGARAPRRRAGWLARHGSRRMNVASLSDRLIVNRGSSAMDRRTFLCGVPTLSMLALGPSATRAQSRKNGVMLMNRIGPSSAELYVANADGTGERKFLQNSMFEY